MDSMIFQKLEAISELVVGESANIKKLEDHKIEKLCQMFGMQLKPKELFYNEFNLFFTDPKEFEVFKFMLPDSAQVITLEVPEYDEYLFVLRYVNDSIISSILA